MQKIDWQNSKQIFTATWTRFYLAIISSLLGVLLGLWLWYSHNSETDIPYIHTQLALGAAFAFGFPWFISAQLLLEKFNLSKIFRLGIRAMAVVVVGIYGFVAHHLNLDPYFLAVTNIAVHALAFWVLAFKVNNRTYWSLMWQVVKRIFFTGLYCGIFAIGLVFISLAIDYLFNVRFAEEFLGYANIVLFGVIGGVYFLAGIPYGEEVEELYPVFLRRIAQYVLFPLLSIAAIVLYVYGTHILFTKTWPANGVVPIITVFSVTAMVTYLVAYPIFIDKVQTKKRLFLGGILFVGLIPLMALYLVAIYVRIAAYALTVDRYYVVLYGVGILILSLYWLLSKSKRLMALPAIVVVLSSLSLFGPWSAKNLSILSQMHRLKNILEQNTLLQNGKVISNGNNLSRETAIGIVSTIKILQDYKALPRLQPWFKDSIVTTTASTSSFGDEAQIDTIIHTMGISGSASDIQYGYDRLSFYNYSPQQVINVAGYDYSFSFDLSNEGNNLGSANKIFVSKEKSDAVEHSLNTELKKNILHISWDSQELIAVSLENTIKNLLDFKGSLQEISVEQMTVVQENDRAKVKILLNNFNLNDNKIIRYVSGQILLQKK